MTKNDIGSYLGVCFSGVPTAAFNGTLKVANGAFAIFAGSSGGLCNELVPVIRTKLGYENLLNIDIQMK